MTKYKCGCESDGIIISNNNVLSYYDYKQWSETVGVFGTRELCLYCWLEKYNINSGLYCSYKKGKWKKKNEMS